MTESCNDADCNTPPATAEVCSGGEPALMVELGIAAAEHDFRFENGSRWQELLFHAVTLGGVWRIIGLCRTSQIEAIHLPEPLAVFQSSDALARDTCDRWDAALRNVKEIDSARQVGILLLWDYVSQMRGSFIIGVLASAIQGLLGTVGRFLVLRQLILDIGQSANLAWLATLIVFYFMIAILEGFCAVLSRQLLPAIMAHAFIARFNALLMRKVGRIAGTSAGPRNMSSRSKESENIPLSTIYAGDFPRLLGYVKWLCMLPAGITSLLGGIFIVMVYLGSSGLVSLFAVVVVLGFQQKFSKRARSLEPTLFKARDERVKAIEEAIKGIKAVKFYGWEDQLFAVVSKKRAEQLAVLLKYRLFLLVSVSMGKVFPVLATFVTLFAVGMSRNGELVAGDAFGAVAVFQTIRVGMIIIPYSIILLNTVIQVHERIAKYLMADELVPVHEEDSTSVAITMQDVEMVFDEGPRQTTESASKPGEKDQKEDGLALGVELKPQQRAPDSSFTLSIGTLAIESGTLTGIIGPVGSGKSVWINLILGSQRLSKGKISRETFIGYAPQEPFVASGTIKENIVFGRNFDEAELKTAIRLAAFERDVSLLSDGVNTVVGERGATLSGGQQARLQVARAFYGSPNLLILDSSLAAVDAAVAREMFDALREWVNTTKKTAVLVLSQMHFLAKCDRIICFDNGNVVWNGTPDEVTSHPNENDNESFVSFLRQSFVSIETNKIERPIPENIKFPSTPPVIGGKGESIPSICAAAETGVHASWQPKSKADDPAHMEEESTDSMNSYVPPAELRGQASASAPLVRREKMHRGGVSMKVLLAWARNVGYGRLLLVVFLFIVASTILFLSDIALAVWTSSDGARARRWMYIYTGIAFSHLPALMTSVVLLVVFCARAGVNLHGKTFANVLNAPNQWFESEPSGRILSRFTGDTDVIDLEWANQVDAWMTMMAMVLMIIIAICYLVPIMVPINFFATIGIVKTLQIINVANRDLKRIANSAISPCVTDATEAEAGQTVARAHGCLSFHVKRQQQNMDNTLAAFFMSSSVQQAAYANATAWCSLLALATSLSIVFAGDAWVRRRLAPIALTYALAAPYFASMLSEIHLQVCLYATSLERLFDYLPEVGSLPSEAPREQPADKEVQPSWPFLGTLEFKKVSLRYRPGLPLALSSVSFRLDPGETCAVCGRTGSGKSTILVALFRIVEPSEGTIIIDGIDVGTLGLKLLRRRLCLIPQEAVLFRGTGKTNTDPFDEFSDKIVADALETVGLPRSFLHQELIAENESSTLSTGERQLLALARCVLRRSTIVALDEATAHVDSQTDTVVQSIIASEFGKSTRLAIAHRLHTVIGYDKMLVMSDGHVAQFGKPSDLMRERQGPLAAMLAGLDDTAVADLTRIADEKCKRES